MMNIGTKSVLFGVHQFLMHPLFVAWAWWRLYGCPWDPRLWVAFFLHDLGYVGSPNIEGIEGEQHPEFAAKIMTVTFGEEWGDFCLLHSRFYAKKLGRSYSRLCVADKLAIALVPRWLYLLQASLTGELAEYMRGSGARTPAGEMTPWQWLKVVQDYCDAWAYQHRNGCVDLWTGNDSQANAVLTQTKE